MVRVDTVVCPICGGMLVYFDTVKRIVRRKFGQIDWIKIRRLICTECKMVHRELPSILYPYKHYEAAIIRGVIQGQISFFDLDYEDYPCEATMKRWREIYSLYNEKNLV